MTPLHLENHTPPPTHSTGLAASAASLPSHPPRSPLRHRITAPFPLAPICYQTGRWFFKFAFLVSMRVRILNKSSLRLPGGFILACTHLSHLEPLVASVVCPRRIDWMARSEFFRSRILTILLRIVDSFSVQREGVAIKAFRTALDRLRRGRIVGVFPEGLVSPGINSACRGGAIKLGACAIAIRAAVPIIPCIILGTDQLNSIRPWLPTKSGRLYLAFGDPIYPPAISSAISAGPLRRKARMEMGNQLARSYVDLYANALKTFELEERDIP